MLASLDSAGMEALLVALFQLMELIHGRRMIEGKGWWGVAAKLVAWIRCSRVRGMEASNCLSGKRKEPAEEVSTARLALDLLQQVLYLCSQPWSAWQIASLKLLQAVVMAASLYAYRWHHQGAVLFSRSLRAEWDMIHRFTASHM